MDNWFNLIFIHSDKLFAFLVLCVKDWRLVHLTLLHGYTLLHKRRLTLKWCRSLLLIWTTTVITSHIFMQVFHDSVSARLGGLASMLAMWGCPWCQSGREGGGQDGWLFGSRSAGVFGETCAEFRVGALGEQVLLLGGNVASSLVGGLLLGGWLIEVICFVDLAIVIVLNIEDQCSVWLLEQVLGELVHGLVARIVIVITANSLMLIASLLWSFLGALGSVWPGSWINLLLHVHLIGEILGPSTWRLSLIIVADTTFRG